MDDSEIINLLQNVQSTGPVTTSTINQYNTTSNVSTSSTVENTTVTNSQTVTPIVEQPACQPPTVIVQTVYVQPPSLTVNISGPTLTNELNSVFDPVNNFQPTINVAPGVGGIGGGGGGGPVQNPVQPQPQESGGGNGGIPYPVDLDTPLAFIFSPDDAGWKQKAISFYGDALPMIANVDTLSDMMSNFEQWSQAAFPGVWPEVNQGNI
jgi:hypothetical protein